MNEGRNPTQKEIDLLRLKIYRMYTRQEMIIDTLMGIILFFVVFGIGFTFGYYHRP